MRMEIKKKHIFAYAKAPFVYRLVQNYWLPLTSDKLTLLWYDGITFEPLDMRVLDCLEKQEMKGRSPRFHWIGAAGKWEVLSHSLWLAVALKAANLDWCLKTRSQPLEATIISSLLPCTEVLS